MKDGKRAIFFWDLSSEAQTEENMKRYWNANFIFTKFRSSQTEATGNQEPLLGEAARRLSEHFDFQRLGLFSLLAVAQPEIEKSISALQWKTSESSGQSWNQKQGWTR